MEVIGSIALAFAAGVLTVTSPCILPILPAVLGLAVTQSRGHAMLVAVGLATGFTVLGISISLFGSLLGQDSNTVRVAGGAMLVGFGLLMLVPSWQYRVLGRIQLSLPNSSGPSAWSPFLTGLLLGVTWIPCAGPVLGGISALVFSRADVALGTAMFFVYAVGVVLPMIAVVYAGKQTLLRGLMKHQARLTRFAGAFVALAGLLVLTGFDWELQNLIQRFYTGWTI